MEECVFLLFGGLVQRKSQLLIALHLELLEANICHHPTFYQKEDYEYHAILEALERSPALRLFPFSLYIITHELIHIVRFTKFLQSFVATDSERLLEEIRVHDKTHEILKPVRIPDITAVFDFYARWRDEFDSLRDPA